MIRRIVILIVEITVAIILPLIATAYIVYHIYPRSMAVYPEADYGIAVYSDKKDGGSSTINYKDSDSLFNFEYILDDKSKIHYAGAAFYRKYAEHWDLSKFNSLTITLKTRRNDQLRIFIKSFIDGFSRPGNYNTYLCSEKEIQTKGDFTDYTLDFKSFYTPIWWYTNNNLPYSYGKKIHQKKITSVELVNAESCDPGVMKYVCIKQIEFANRYSLLYFLAIAVGFAGYCFIAFLFFSKKLWAIRTE
ncbi:MAG TPA: hypothetical protein VHO70_18130, partial [Chitinispirillaceae bacterium]|nr:hypothetical protein [Chitinispirillaceae bacterium]